MIATSELREILDKFQITGEFIGIETNKVGHINDTFIAGFKNKDNHIQKFVLQRINTYIFTNPKELMNNIDLVTKHIADKIAKEGKDPIRGTLHIVKSKENNLFEFDNHGQAWRVYNFITDASTYMKVEQPEYMYKTGKAIGNFMRQLDDFDASKLFDILPNFHNTEKRYEDFVKCVENNLSGRREDVLEEIDFIKERSEETKKINEYYRMGKLPLRVTHNDTKFNNVMIDNNSGEPIAVIDLDTVMPGFSIYDFADSIRTGATTALEDETDLSMVNFDIEMFEAYAKGFLESSREILTETEIDNLAFGAKLITLEQAMRFLGDHIDGDRYYKIHRPFHNLDRARNQIKLVKEMEANMDMMKEIIKKYSK